MPVQDVHEPDSLQCHRRELADRNVDDLAAEYFLQWFVTEQVEEESAPEEILQKLNLVGDAPHMVFMIDRELGARQ